MVVPRGDFDVGDWQQTWTHLEHQRAIQERALGDRPG